MRSPHLALCALALAASGFMACACHAQSDKAEPSPHEFSIRSYPLPILEFEDGVESKPSPEMPPPDASQGEQEDFLKRSHEIMKGYLLTRGLELPSGSLASFDPATGTLSVRTMNSVHRIIESLSEASVRQVPKHISWRLEIVEAMSADVRAAVKQCQGRVQHGKQLDELLAKGVAITTMRGEGKGGQQMTARQGSGFNSPAGYFTNASGQLRAEREWTRSGVQIELDPVIGEQGSIDINLHLQYWPTAPKARLAQLTAGSAPKVEAEWLDLPAFTTTFSTTFQNGDTRLLGIWDLETLADPAKTGRSQAAFLCTHGVSRLRLPDPRLELMLRERGEAVVPIPKAVGTTPKPEPARPPGMVIRLFHVPPDFETMSSSPSGKANGDPFDATIPPPSQAPLFRPGTAEEILRNQGIPFPPGSFARIHSITGKLIVCNLPENLELVESYVRSLCCLATKMVQTTVEIIEADATLLRRLARETEALADHTAALKTLEAEIAAGKARVFRTAWIETKGGQQATWKNIILTKTLSEFGFLSSPEKEEGKPEAKEPATKGRSPALYVHSEEENVGFEVELDPVIGEDGVVDLNLSIKADTATIGTLPAAPEPPPGTQRLATVNAVRRSMEIKTSINFYAGTPRLLTLYQPTTSEGPVANVLHAVFVRSDIASVDLPDE